MQADLILYGGIVHTQDPTLPRAEAVAIGKNRILATGSTDRITAMAGPHTGMVDLQGACVVPGFTESHMHFYDFALGRRQVWMPDCSSLAEAMDRVREAAARTEPGSWIIGMSWVESGWPENRQPTRDDLDRVAPDVPVICWRADLHMAVCNSEALRLGGVDASTPDPDKGIIGRDPDGRPNGRLYDLAINLVKRRITGFSDTYMADAMAEAIRPLHELGITAIHDLRLMGGLEGAQAMRALQLLNGSGRLDLRCWMMLPGESLEQAIALGLRTGHGDDRLRIGHLKYYGDGSMGASTAWMQSPYTEEAGGGSGMVLTPPEELREALIRANSHGLAVTVHGIGDMATKGLAGVLAEIAPLLPSGPEAPSAPNRIEHLQMVRPEDLQRIAASGVVASVQPMQILDDIDIIDRGLTDRGRFTYPFKSILEAGLPMAFGSDCPVTDPSPLMGIHAAVTRTRLNGYPQGGWYPDQCLTPEQALWSYTMGPAISTGLDGVLGSVTPGKFADLAILDRDILGCDVSDIHKTEVIMTIFDGRIVHDTGFSGSEVTQRSKKSFSTRL